MTPPVRRLILSSEEDAALRSLELSAGIHVKVRLRASIVRLNASGVMVPRLARHRGADRRGIEQRFVSLG